MTKLEGKVALVTGASRGIGAAVARGLASEGVRVGLASRSGDDLGLEGAVAQPCDVRDPVQLESLAAATVERFERLSPRSASRGPSTSCASRASVVRTSARAEWRPTSRWAGAARRRCRS